MLANILIIYKIDYDRLNQYKSTASIKKYLNKKDKDKLV